MDERLETGRTLDALRRKNLEGKKTFVEELRRQKTPQALSLLLEILCDESWYLRELAIDALAEMGSTAVPPVRRLLATGLWYTRAAAARALGRLGDGASAGTILLLVTDPNVAVHDAAVRALREMAAAGGGAAIRDALAALPAEKRTPRLEVLSQAAPELARAAGEAGAVADAAAAGAGRTGDSPRTTDSPRASDERHAGGGSADTA